MSRALKNAAGNLSHPKYRPDIDGLRAVAVLSVVVFHAFPMVMPGGFIGVDIFFIISGFLITTILLQNQERGTFSYAIFYDRRIRRILPSLTIVVLFSVVAGWFLLLPDEYKQFGKHVAGGATFTSNIVLLRESGYFDVSAELKPLLHLWSLAIEEQFYIVWPVVIAFACKWRRGFTLVTGLLIAASFLINLYLLSENPNAAFYTPFSRFWELMIGGALAYWATTRRDSGGIFVNARSIVGVVLLALGFLLISKDRGFPGWWALMPCVGAVLLISAGPRAWLNKVVLSNKIVVWLGLISYPLYLWHWPLLSFARISEGEAPEASIRAAVVGVSVLFAWLTYKFIETPVRVNGRIGSKALLLIFFFVSLLGFSAFLSNGYVNRIRHEPYFERYRSLVDGVDAQKYAGCPAAFAGGAFPINQCMRSKDGPASMALFGDSHAEDKFAGLAKIDQKHNWLLVGNSSCPPVNGVSIEGSIKNCQQRTEYITEALIRDSNISTVVLAFFGNSFLPPYAADHVARHLPPDFTKFSVNGVEHIDRSSVFFLGLEKTVSLLIKGGKKVVILVDTPELPFLPRSCLRALPAERCRLARDDVLSRQAELRVGLQRMVQKHTEVALFDPIELFCNNSYCTFESEREMYYKDSHHLSMVGSKLYAGRLLEWLDRRASK